MKFTKLKFIELRKITKGFVLTFLLMALLSPSVLNASARALGGGGGGDTTGPTVSITSPSNGASVSGYVSISASASDSSGVLRVLFYIDGAWKTSDTSYPYSYNWNTNGENEGPHTIIARAFDTVGNSRDSSIVVNVDNLPLLNYQVNLDIRTGSYDKWGVPYRYASATGDLIIQISNDAYDLPDLYITPYTGLYTYYFSSDRTSIQLTITATFTGGHNSVSPTETQTIVVTPNVIPTVIMTPSVDNWFYDGSLFTEQDWTVSSGTYIVISDYNEYSTEVVRLGISKVIALTINSIVTDADGAIIEMDIDISTAVNIEVLWAVEPIIGYRDGDLTKVEIQANVFDPEATGAQFNWETIPGTDYYTSAEQMRLSDPVGDGDLENKAAILATFSQVAKVLSLVGVPYIGVAGFIFGLASNGFAGLVQQNDFLDSGENNGVAVARYQRYGNAYGDDHMDVEGNLLSGGPIKFLSTYNSFEIRKDPSVNIPITISVSIEGLVDRLDSQNSNRYVSEIKELGTLSFTIFT